MHSISDRIHMSEALRLAKMGLYTTSPNPRVGAVVVRDGTVIGTGWHRRAGEPHAEINALQGIDAKGAEIYVTLEPCSHHGRTPPCADALIAAGLSRVVVAMEDPNPLVAGRGISRLREAGIRVECGLLENEARALNVGFVSRMTRGRPWVRMKVAASLDGKTALSNGESRWITGEAARRDGHRLRARSCAILTGIGTVLGDDPQMNVRQIETSRQPLKVIVDSRLRIPENAKILEGGAIVVCASGNREKAERLAAAGVEVLFLPGNDGRVDLHALLVELGSRGINELHVEAGETLSGALLSEGLVDEIVAYMAPVLLGSRARGMFGIPELETMDSKISLEILDMRMVGKDLRVIWRPNV